MRHPHVPTPASLPGLELSRRFCTEAARSLPEESVPGVPHSAALVADQAHARRAPSQHLSRPAHPLRRRGGPGRPGRARHRRPGAPPGRSDRCPSWFRAALGFGPASGATPVDWLATPAQFLAESTAGAVFHHGLRTLSPARAAPGRPRMTSGSVSSPASGGASRRGRRSSAAARGRRRTRFRRRGSPTGPRPRVALPSDGPALSAVRQVARQRLRPDARGAPAHLRAVNAALAATQAGLPDWHARERQPAHAYEIVAHLHNELELTDRADPPVPTPGPSGYCVPTASHGPWSPASRLPAYGACPSSARRTSSSTSRRPSAARTGRGPSSRR